MKLTCELGAFDGRQAARYSEVRAALEASATGAEPIIGGYAISFPNEPEVVMMLAEFTTLERLCCAFLDLAVKLPAGSDRVELHMSGGPGTREFLTTELGL